MHRSLTLQPCKVVDLGGSWRQARAEHLLGARQGLLHLAYIHLQVRAWERRCHAHFREAENEAPGDPDSCLGLGHALGDTEHVT